MSEASFYRHCEEPGCDLGHVEYDCPVCGRAGSDYGDLWWDHEKVYDDQKLAFACERCGAQLLLQLDADRYPEVVTCPSCPAASGPSASQSR